MLWAGAKLFALVSDCLCEWLGLQGAARALRGREVVQGAAAWQEFAGQHAQLAQCPALRAPLCVCLPAAHT